MDIQSPILTGSCLPLQKRQVASRSTTIISQPGQQKIFTSPELEKQKRGQCIVQDLRSQPVVQFIPSGTFSFQLHLLKSFIEAKMTLYQFNIKGFLGKVSSVNEQNEVSQLIQMNQQQYMNLLLRYIIEIEHMSLAFQKNTNRSNDQIIVLEQSGTLEEFLNHFLLITQCASDVARCFQSNFPLFTLYKLSHLTNLYFETTLSITTELLKKNCSEAKLMLIIQNANQLLLNLYGISQGPWPLENDVFLTSFVVELGLLLCEFMGGAYKEFGKRSRLLLLFQLALKYIKSIALLTEGKEDVAYRLDVCFLFFFKKNNKLTHLFSC
jgi:hypothetical protein